MFVISKNDFMCNFNGQFDWIYSLKYAQANKLRNQKLKTFYADGEKGTYKQANLL